MNAARREVTMVIILPSAWGLICNAASLIKKYAALELIANLPSIDPVYRTRTSHRIPLQKSP